jgi:hypothetical protein
MLLILFGVEHNDLALWQDCATRNDEDGGQHAFLEWHSRITSAMERLTCLDVTVAQG